MYKFTKDKSYLNDAFWVAQRVLLFKIRKNKGIAFPGEGHLRLSCDYGTGSSGIGIFLNRLIKNKKRKFVNDYLLEDL